MTITQQIIGTGVLYLLSIGLGFWLSHSGRPLNKLLSVVHKLVSLGAAVVTVLVLGDLAARMTINFGRYIDGYFSIGRKADALSASLFAASGVCIIALIATGAVLSGAKQPRKTALWIHNISAVLVVACLTGAVYLSGYYAPKPILLPNGMEKVEYVMAASAESPDDKFYSADMNYLKSRDSVCYTRYFGRIDDAKTAASVAVIVHQEVYGDPSGKFIVYYNQNAGCWIVYDNLPPDVYGGYGYFAIHKETGQIVMVVHYK